MNSYPHEFLEHPQPLMFVAGLLPSSRTRSSSTSASGGVGVSLKSSLTGSASLDVSRAGPAALTTPISSPGPAAHTDLPTSPPVTADESDPLDQGAGPSRHGSAEQAAGPDREFEDLTRNLREALQGSGGKERVWLPAVERKDFRITLVDKHVRLPMRKVNPGPSATSENPTPHSPLSPLTPTSPLHPDGLVAPVWVRKHAEMVPAVFVLFLRLYEPPEASPEEQNSTERKAKEQEMDDVLVKEIGDRRRRLGERGIKLTVVLMASSAALESPQLDSRLSYLRRASALSAKASLFVLSPVPADQLPEFVHSLQTALYDSAMEYYASHGKRVKRKRARVSGGALAAPGAAGKVLGAQGWAVRYDWKSGWFAEIRGDFDEARRCYEDCWNELARMFSSTQTLPPRTKRWAEAKVLADCVAVRICRLLLYSDEAPKVLTPFYVHLKRFGDLSRGWGIGEETFEFWSWLSRQYRIFAELLELGCQNELRIPSLVPPTLPTAQFAAIPPTPEYWSTPISSVNPLQILQQPAFYFYTAATCSMQRKKRFEEALALEDSNAASSAGEFVSTAPGFANEKKVDHSGLIVELLTKAYSLFKGEQVVQSRTALYVAYKIAEVYCETEQHDMAMRFLERISTTFKANRWSEIVRRIRALWYECAQRTGQVDTAARLLVEMMSPESGIEGEDRVALQDDLLSLMKTTSPASVEPISIDATGADPLQIEAGFWSEEAFIGQSVPLQIAISCPENVYMSNLAFTALTVSFSDHRPDLVIRSSQSPESSDVVNVGMLAVDGENAAVSARLKWESGSRLVIQGMLAASKAGECSVVAGVRLDLQEGPWKLQIDLSPTPLTCWYSQGHGPLPRASLSPRVSFRVRPHDVTMSVKHASSILTDEPAELVLTITSNDERQMRARLSVFLQPGDEDDASTIQVEGQSSTSLIGDLDLGQLDPGSSLEKHVLLKASTIGSKVIDFSLQTTPIDAEPDGRGSQHTEEHDTTVVTTVLAPFDAGSSVTYQSPKLGDGHMQAPAMVSTVLRAIGTAPVQVADLRLKSLPNIILITSSLSSGIPFPTEWAPGTSFSIFSQFRVSPPDRISISETGLHFPAEICIKWRSNPLGEWITTALPLPPLTFPIQASFLTAHLSFPPSTQLHTAFPITLTVINAHPAQDATDLSITMDTAEAFVWTGNRSWAIPDLRPLEERKVVMHCVPVGGTGWFELPRLRVSRGPREGEGRGDVALLANGDAQPASSWRIFVRQ